MKEKKKGNGKEKQKKEAIEGSDSRVNQTFKREVL